MKMNKSIPWVFWLRIRKRSWFKPLYYARFANSGELQLLRWCISIGLPWLNGPAAVLDWKKTNSCNERMPLSIKFGKHDPE